MIGRNCLVGLALVAAASVARTAPPAQPAPFTEAQAAEGSAIYAQRCALCHGRSLEGTFEVPALTGKFIANWGGRPLADLSRYLDRAMPQFAPGTLEPEDTARLVAYILQANGYPAGSRALPADPHGLEAAILAPAPAR